MSLDTTESPSVGFPESNPLSPALISFGFTKQWSLSVEPFAAGFRYEAKRAGVLWASGYIRSADRERVIRMAKTHAMDAYGIALQAGEVES